MQLQGSAGSGLNATPDTWADPACTEAIGCCALQLAVQADMLDIGFGFSCRSCSCWHTAVNPSLVPTLQLEKHGPVWPKPGALTAVTTSDATHVCLSYRRGAIGETKQNFTATSGRG